MEQQEKVRLSVEIFGTTYKIVGNFSENYMRKLSGYVNEWMNTIAKANPRLDTLKVAVLSMVQIADEYFKMRFQRDELEDSLTQAKARMEELKKAFDLSEEKERRKSDEVARLKEQIAALEAAREESRREAELASSVWAEQVAEWKAKFEEAQAVAERVRQLEERVQTLENERNSLLAALEQSRQEAAAAKEKALALPDPVEGAEPASDETESEGELTLEEKYRKLQLEYIKLKNEFDEWIQLTLSETQ